MLFAYPITSFPEALLELHVIAWPLQPITRGDFRAAAAHVRADHQGR